VRQKRESKIEKEIKGERGERRRKREREREIEGGERDWPKEEKNLK
jgi:hypothetical protein